MIIQFLQTIARPMFGQFEREEFKKFLRMGTIFALIIGSYWTLRVLKDSIFINLVGKHYLPWAKTASLIFLFPLVIFYTKLLDKYSREKMFYILSSVYGVATLVFSICMFVTQAPADVIAARTGLAHLGTQVVGYLWYVFVESFGSLFPALFWAFSADITSSESAKKGFSLVVAIGQFGGIVGPFLIGGLPKRLGFSTSTVSLMVCALFILAIMWVLSNFLKATPKHLLESFHGKNEASVEKEQEPGFFEGLKLLMKHNYLIAIFGVIFIFEMIVTIFDYNFKVLAGTHYSGTDLDAYLGTYGASVNTVALICLLLGVSNITRILGVGAALVLMPIIFTGALYGFITMDSLNFLFYLMVGSKAINYALNGPAMKQLYIPTTHDVRFKSQAWIETFGSRGSKEAGSIFNMSLGYFSKAMGEVAGRARYILIGGYLCASLIVVWFFTALYLGKTYKKALDEKRVVC
jgi:AAA family ATP:ADP antiporter